MSTKVAYNAEDRFVVGIGNQIVVATLSGDFWAHDVNGQHVSGAYKLNGSKGANNQQDRFLASIGNLIIVTTRNGDTFGHQVSGRNISIPFKFGGAKVAFNDNDRFVTSISNKIVVITKTGEVWGHVVTGRDIGPAFKFSGSKAAWNPQDKFVVGIGNMLLVTTENGDVFGHDVNDHTINAPFKLAGSRMAYNKDDRFVFTVGRIMIVTTKSGDAFGAELNQREFSPVFKMNEGDEIKFHARMRSDLHMEGQADLTVKPNGDYSLKTHAHNGGASNIDYAMGLVLMSPSGTAFTFKQGGNIEGTLDDLNPFDKPKRDDDHTQNGNSPVLKAEYPMLWAASFTGILTGEDTLVRDINKIFKDLIAEAVKQLGAAAVKAVIAL